MYNKARLTTDSYYAFNKRLAVNVKKRQLSTYALNNEQVKNKKIGQNNVNFVVEKENLAIGCDLFYKKQTPLSKRCT